VIINEINSVETIIYGDGPNKSKFNLTELKLKHFRFKHIVNPNFSPCKCKIQLKKY
jgi:hypothetical protein